MIKKAILGTMALATIGTLAFGTDAFSYARTGFHSAKARIRSEVPLEFEIERAKQEVDRLLPEVKKSMYVIANQEVEVQQLRKSIARREATLAKQEEAILTLTSDLKQNSGEFRYAGHRYTQHQVEKDLAERFNRFKVAEEALAADNGLLAAKEQALVSNRETLETMLSQKKNLEVELERLEARLRTVAARKQVNGLEVDDSQLNRVKALITTIEKRLDVEDAMLAAEGDLHGLIRMEEHAAEDHEQIAAEVEAYFGNRFSEEPREMVAH